MEEKKKEFLYKSIEDTQATIRAIDVKAGFLFAVNLLPITALEKIITVSKNLFETSGYYFIPVLLIFSIWIIALCVLFRTIKAISNPSSYVKSNNNSPNGIFYSPALYNLSFLDNFQIPSLKSKSDLDTQIESLPSNDKELIRELMFEKMKLSYIRDIKLSRLNICLVSTLFWVFLGCLCWSIYLFKV